MRRTRVDRPDGRYLYLYSFDREPPALLDTEPLRRDPDERLELRRNPLLDDDVIISTARQDRTFLPPDEYCPLCPTRPGGPPTEIPAEDFEIAVFENRFGALRPDAPEVHTDEQARRAAGACEVIVYSPDHEASLASLSTTQVQRLVRVWADRYHELSGDRSTKCVFIFENRGREIGVTLTHPHGQIYAFPYVPPRMLQERAAAGRFGCLMCDVAASELAGPRVIASNEAFVAYVPFAARVPYEVHVTSRQHHPCLLTLTDPERDTLASMLQQVQAVYDALWDRPMPYTMSMHQAPVGRSNDPADHLHIEFMPPYRTQDKLKYLAGVETGAGTYINDTLPEEKAAELRAAGERIRR